MEYFENSIIPMTELGRFNYWWNTTKIPTLGNMFLASTEVLNATYNEWVSLGKSGPPTEPGNLLPLVLVIGGVALVMAMTRKKK